MNCWFVRVTLGQGTWGKKIFAPDPDEAASIVRRQWLKYCSNDVDILEKHFRIVGITKTNEGFRSRNT